MDAPRDLTVSDAVWVATALLHREAPQRGSFPVETIVERCLDGLLPSEQGHHAEVHATLQCVANMRPNPADMRYLTATPDGGRRLYRPGDAFHPDRVEGATHPPESNLPPRYRQLLPWYLDTYVPRGSDDDEEDDAAPTSEGPASYKVVRVREAREAELLLRGFAAEGWHLAEALPVDDEDGPTIWLILER